MNSMSSIPTQSAVIKILSLVEATNINAVAKNVLEFYRSADEQLRSAASNIPQVSAAILTFSRDAEGTKPKNEFVVAAEKLDLEMVILSERRRFDPKVLAAIRGAVTAQAPDIVVTHSVKSHFLLWRSGVARQIPWVAFHHGYTTTDLKMRAYNQLDKWSLPHADRLVTVCKAFAEELAAKTGVPVGKIAVQHNSIRPRPIISKEEAAALRLKLGFADDVRLILAVGRLSHEKAHHDLLEAFARLRTDSARPDLKLVIVGDGPERTRLEKQAASLDIASDVKFMGQQSDVHAYYAIADVLVLPSHSEGSPNVLLEAMAARVPIVATSVGGVPELVQHQETALLVRPNATGEMASAVSAILGDDALAQRLAANASAAVATRHTPAHYVESLIRVYQEAISEWRSAHS